MSGYCTCGAKLPEDARFCHKCGKPQRDEPLLVEEAPPLPPPPPPPPQFPPIGFRNRAAVGAALISAIAGFLLSIVSGQLLPAASIVGLLAAGFMAVYLYQRRTGQRLSMAHGAHLGWIAGIFGFAGTAVMLSVFIAALSSPTAVDAVRKQWQGAGIGEAQIDQMFEVLHSPSLLLMVVLLMFLLCTLLPAFGGALGAKFFDRK